MPPNHRLLALALRRLSSNAPLPPRASTRQISSSSMHGKWEGRKAEEHATRETDRHNVQQEAVREGKEERAKGKGSSGTTEEGGGWNRKAEEENKEAPRPVIGMNDERGGKGH